MLHSTLDAFALRMQDKNSLSQDLGLLQAIDERLSVWGWQTSTGTRFAIVLDMWGREGQESIGMGIRDGDLKPAFKALQTAYIRLLMNPFYDPDEHTPMAAPHGRGKGMQITSKKFTREVERIGMAWKPGMTNI